MRLVLLLLPQVWLSRVKVRKILARTRTTMHSDKDAQKHPVIAHWLIGLSRRFLTLTMVPELVLLVSVCLPAGTVGVPR